MTLWDFFLYFALISVALWLAGALAAWRHKAMRTVGVLTGMGIMVYLTFIILMWNDLGRPPMRTMGETRMWYALFMPVVGLLIYRRWRYRWILWFSTGMAAIFIAINLLHPEIHDRTLMPALQSMWFVPHVAVYIFAYALIGSALLMSVWLLGIKRRTASDEEMAITDSLVDSGLALLTFGMLFGALWAKDAWGHYWTWDPKETWAAATWLACLVYEHFRMYRSYSQRTALWILILVFILLQMCWWGINYLPSAQATSVHTYNF